MHPLYRSQSTVNALDENLQQYRTMEVKMKEKQLSKTTVRQLVFPTGKSPALNLFYNMLKF